MPTPRPLAPLLLLPGGLALLTGMDAGLTLAGVPAPVGSARLAELHGPLMVLGFLGTVIALERATALRAAWGFLAPGLCAAGALALVVLPAPLAGRLLLAQGLLTLALVYAALWRRNRDVTIAVEGLGAVLALAAALLLTRVEVAAVLPLLVGFVVLTIAAERVELARLAMPSGAGDRVAVLAGVVALAAATVVAVAGSPVVGSIAWRALGLGLLLLTFWLVRHDVARRMINATGLPRFAATALLAGYVWLALAGLLLLLLGRPGGQVYDVVVHATFLGFAMSMILAHAPVILPAVLRVRLPYHRAMWVPLILLHLTLAGRVLSLALVGIGLQTLPVWQLALLGNVAALILFLLISVVIGTRATRAVYRPAPHEAMHHA